MRLDQAKDRSIQEYLETPSNTVFWCNLKLAQEKGLQFYQSRLHAVVLCDTLLAACTENSRMNENEGGALPRSTLNSKIAMGCTQSEFAQRSTRSTRPRRKIILGPTQRIEELQGNLEQRR